MAYHNPERGRVLANKARTRWAEAAVVYARELLVKVGFKPARRQIVEALRLSRSPRIMCKVCSFLFLWFRITGARFKRWIKSQLDTSIQSQTSK